MGDKIMQEAKFIAAVAVMMVSGLLGAVLLLGLIPGDGMDFNVVGSLALIAVCAPAFWVSNRHVTRRVGRTNR